MTTEEAKEKIFRCIISCEISLFISMYPPSEAVVPISNIIHLVKGLTKYRARKALKELIADGLIYYTSQGCPAICSYGDYDELIAEAAPPINGYALTDKGRNTDAYIKMVEADEELLKECFGMK